MNHKALVVIDIQNDITSHYRDIINRLNAAIEWAAESGMETEGIVLLSLTELYQGMCG